MRVQKAHLEQAKSFTVFPYPAAPSTSYSSQPYMGHGQNYRRGHVMLFTNSAIQDPLCDLQTKGKEKNVLTPPTHKLLHTNFVACCNLQ